MAPRSRAPPVKHVCEPVTARLLRASGVKLQYVGRVDYLYDPPSLRGYERIVAGELIPDCERKAYKYQHEEDSIDLPFIPNTFSGSMGFVDFRQDYPHLLYIGYLGVEPDARRKGIGSLLVREVERYARLRGASKVSLNTERSRHAKVWPFYRSLGYDVVGESEGSYLLSRELFRRESSSV